jgi:heterodisulfide reductase subunit C
VGPLAALLANRSVLPAEKLLLTTGSKPRDPAALRRLAEGAHACTDCGRCTRICPSGIDLADLWGAGRASLAEQGHPPAADWVKATPAAGWAERITAGAPGGGSLVGPSPLAQLPTSTALIADQHAFVPCVQCQTCTNVCPVVGASQGDPSGVDATPQKVMNLLRLGLGELALGSRMVWDCATCYQCQEHCPAGIPVTDVLYELRNRAYARLGDARADDLRVRR